MFHLPTIEGFFSFEQLIAEITTRSSKTCFISMDSLAKIIAKQVNSKSSGVI
jgi:hypothetical protein